jgi:hypothetical protein
MEIARLGGIPLVMDGLRMTHEEELVAQCARAIRNLSVHRKFNLSTSDVTFCLSPPLCFFAADNKEEIIELGGIELLSQLAKSKNERVAAQVSTSCCSKSRVLGGFFFCSFQHHFSQSSRALRNLSSRK